MKALFPFSLILSIFFLPILSKINHDGDTPPSKDDEKPRLFVFSVGPDADDLSYTSGDAVRVACTMESQVFSKTYGDCRVEGLFGEEAKAIRIIEDFKTFLSKGDLNERDIVIFYISSHGYIDNDEMFIKASDFKRDKKTNKILGGVVSIKDISNELKRYPCKKLLLIDACRTHLTKDEAPAEKTEERQVNIYSSELGERSNEAEKLEAGLFTYVLLEGLKGEADDNEDNRIQLNELWDYLQDEVPSLANSLNTEKQKPIMIEGDSVDNSIVLFEYQNNQSGYIVECNVASPERIEKIANVDAELIYETQLIEVDSFIMGSSKDEECRKEEEKEHWVKLNDYAIGKYEVTNAQFCEFLNDKYAELSDSTTSSWIKIGKSACRIKDNNQEFVFKDKYADFPVVMVTWHGANEYAKWRSNDYIKYTLPTEAQWEYAAKGPDFGGQYWVYSGNDELRKVSWYKEGPPILKSKADVKAVHALPEEVYGMSGNAAEWCQDVYEEDFYSTPEALKINPICNDDTNKSKQRVVRGGSYKSSPCQCRVASRSHLYPDQTLPDLGFRLVRNVR